MDCSAYLNGLIWVVATIWTVQIWKSPSLLSLCSKDLDPWTEVHVVCVFSVFVALNDIINTLDSMEESDQSGKDKYADVVGNTNRIYFTDESLQEILDDSFVEGELIEQSVIKISSKILSEDF